MILEIFTDGACKGNPGIGGWGALLRYGKHEKEIYGAEEDTTNNQMELRAAIEALKIIKRDCEIHLTTDSNYVKQGIEQWLPNWKRNQWRNSQNKTIKNKELWQELDVLNGRYGVHWHWVKGHSGHAENERVDALANRGIEELRQKLKEQK